MNPYELMLIFDPNLGEEKISQILSKIEEKIKNWGGELIKTDKWGIKRLAGTFQKGRGLTQAYYVVIYFESDSNLPGELQAYLKVTENIVRYLVSRSETPPPAEIAGAPIKTEGEVEPVDVGEIKGEPDIGQS